MRINRPVIVASLALVASLVVPAAVTAGPPLTLVTEPVEEGVVRVVSDGIRDLAPVADDSGHELAIGQDGSVWVWRSDGSFRLGDPASTAQLGVQDEHPELGVGADGGLWVLDDWVLYRLDRQAWTVMRQAARGGIGAFDIAADGSAWSAWLTNTLSPPFGGAGRLTTDGWTDAAFGPELEGVFTGDLGRALEGLRLEAIQGTVDGEAWTIWEAEPIEADRIRVLLHFDGQDWAEAQPVGSGSDADARFMDIGIDGTLWVYLVDTVRGVDRGDRYLARYTSGTWTIFDTSDGVPNIRDNDVARSGRLVVGLDGEVWMSDDEAGPTCNGLLSFDGSVWTRYLAGICVMDLDIAPDGTVWVVEGLSREYHYVAGSTYRIGPIAHRAVSHEG